MHCRVFILLGKSALVKSDEEIRFLKTAAGTMPSSKAPSSRVLSDIDKILIDTGLLQQLPVGPLLCDPAVVDDQDLIGVLDGVQAMGDHEEGLPLHQLGNGLLEIALVVRTGNVNFDGSDAAEIFVKTSTGKVTGNFLTDKVFITQTDTGTVAVPKTVTGGRCKIATDTGDIEIKIG